MLGHFCSAHLDRSLRALYTHIVRRAAGHLRLILFFIINPLVPDAHYSERQDKPFSLQIQQLEVDLKLICGFLFFAPWALMG